MLSDGRQGRAHTRLVLLLRNLSMDPLQRNNTYLFHRKNLVTRENVKTPLFQFLPFLFSRLAFSGCSTAVQRGECHVTTIHLSVVTTRNWKLKSWIRATSFKERGRRPTTFFEYPRFPFFLSFQIIINYKIASHLIFQIPLQRFYLLFACIQIPLVPLNSHNSPRILTPLESFNCHHDVRRDDSRQK